MKEVADRAGVSTATVSRAISQPGRVSPEVRRRIAAAIKELNYTINSTARNLRRKDTHIVLVVVPDIANIFFSLVLKGIEQQARELGYSVLIVDAGAETSELEQAMLDQIRMQRVDGIIVLNGRKVGKGVNLASNDFNLASTGRFSPMVAVSERVPGGKVPLVGIDNVAAAYSAVEFLVRQGHRRIAHLTGPAANPLTEDRLLGFRRALQAAGLPLDPAYLIHGDFQIQSGRRAAETLLALKRPPTAVFASNDAMAIGLIAEARAQGIAIPEQLSVIGFDDIELAAVFHPSITTVRQPRFEMGRTAMAILAEAVQRGEMRSGDVLLDTEFMNRSSVAPRLGSVAHNESLRSGAVLPARIKG